jgi:hypothetical protein
MQAVTKILGENTAPIFREKELIRLSKILITIYENIRLHNPGDQHANNNPCL